MNTRTVRLSRFSAAACATAITAVSAWAFVHSTASTERDPFHFASVMAANARARIVQTVGRQSDQLPEEVRNYVLPDLLAPPPACPGGCA
jgi:hypothetical protein